MDSATKTFPAHSEAPLSGEAVAALPECIQALLDKVAAVPSGASIELTLAALLEVLRRCEPRAAVAVRLLSEAAGEVDLLVASAPEGIVASDGPGALFPGLAEEIVAPLAAPVRGSLHVAAASFERFDRHGAHALVTQAAVVVSLAVRLARAASRVKVLDAEVIQLEKLASLGRSATGIVHELNNPLTAILAYSEYLSQKLHGAAEPTDLDRLGRIIEAAHRIQRYSRDLVDYSRPAAGLPAPVDLHDVIDRALGFCMHGLSGAAIQVERSYGEIPFVDGVESPLTQVFVNLFTNAWHAMAETGGILRIRTFLAQGGSGPAARDRGIVVVEVADDGPGIAEDHLARVFDAYFTTKPKGIGTGLGLDIVRQIVGDHGGRIHAQNHPPHGALFRIDLPLPRAG